VTWIRWETKTPKHELVGDLAEGLKVRRAEALGLYNATCCGFGEYRKDGRADQITDTTLEQWAEWEGRKGRFAEIFRQRCVEQRSGQRDAVGTVKGWWRQAALLEKQVKDNSRPKPAKRPPNSRVNPARESRGKNAGKTGEPAEIPPISPAGSAVDVYDTTLPVRERSLSDPPPEIPAGDGPEGPLPAETPETAQEIQRRRDQLRTGFRERQAETVRP
jgi:hypothetical protein